MYTYYTRTVRVQYTKYSTVYGVQYTGVYIKLISGPAPAWGKGGNCPPPDFSSAPPDGFCPDHGRSLAIG